jgi:hypothetical protein
LKGRHAAAWSCDNKTQKHEYEDHNQEGIIPSTQEEKNREFHHQFLVYTHSQERKEGLPKKLPDGK